VGERIGVTDEEWAIIGPLLPLERGRWSRPAQDNRRYFEGMLWIARSGSQWRHLPDEYGKWNSVFRRFRRWVEIGVFDALIETLIGLVKRDRSADMVDTTIIRAHHCAAGKKGGLKIKRPLAVLAEASRPKSMPGATAKVGRLASQSLRDKHMTSKGSRRSCA
jgi:transposase